MKRSALRALVVPTLLCVAACTPDLSTQSTIRARRRLRSRRWRSPRAPRRRRRRPRSLVAGGALRRRRQFRPGLSRHGLRILERRHRARRVRSGVDHEGPVRPAGARARLPAARHERDVFRLNDLDLSRVARPYERTGTTFTAIPHIGYPTYPDGLVRTSVPQLARFLALFSNGGELDGKRILAASTVAEMQKLQVPALVDSQGLPLVLRHLWHAQRSWARRRRPGHERPHVLRSEGRRWRPPRRETGSGTTTRRRRSSRSSSPSRRITRACPLGGG